jgi:hypothetical protein
VETCDWRLETGDWRLETGDWRLETGDWRLEIGDWRGGRELDGSWKLIFFYKIINIEPGHEQSWPSVV